ncbi:hypothetical protein BDM02DRAFT_3157062 [Thelephora ganbajun]|uniref:Uncharacterized protein n=1 Tax=Thelephora ganbajun TaxID=370292 RepID=A0ACB6Z5Q2_THEGA|nr:hypothetical protein BDM02DRAFT_3157062 [Thelephora ganbajun]
MTVDEQGVKKKKGRSNEAFIVVRPPPSKTNHPLNLQVQLVPPSSRDHNRSASSRRSTDSLATNPELEGQHPLTRTSSNRSDVSTYSGYAPSSTSVGSFSSTTSTRRMIIPLYNLHAHNVMTNVVLDAGTDARVAKFLKRGLEVIGLAVLDPMEVWNYGKIGGGPLLSTEQAATGSTRNSLDHHLSAPALHTPDSSAVSLGSAGDPTPKAPDIIPAATATPSQNTPTSAKKFFGKLFRRKDPSIPGVVELSDSPTSSPLRTSLNLPTPSSPARRSSLLPDQTPSPFPSKDVILQPAVLGIQPTLNAASYPPQGRPTAYVWTVTKWLKGSPEGLLGNVKGIFQGDKSIRDEPTGEFECQVEVRFEWTRMERGGKRKARRAGTDRTGVTIGLSVAGGSKNASRRNSVALTNSDNPSVNSLHDKEKKTKRSSIIEGVQSGLGLIPKRSMESARSRSPKRSGSVTTNTTASETGEGDDEASRSREDDGGESDPEDSEVPWTCTLHVVRRPTGTPFLPTTNTPSGSRFSQRSGQQRKSDLSGSPTPVQQQQQALGVQSTQSHAIPPLQSPPPSQQIKLKVATVSPTPHHPKVVSLLKIPFPLPDIEVSSINVRRRIVTPVGIARPVGTHSSTVGIGTGNLNMQSFSLNGNAGKPRETGLVLTAEEIKDVVASTALWLVVREAMGGVGRDKRKGDGWKLRG